MSMEWSPLRMEQGDQDSALVSHGRRVAALAMEIIPGAAFSASMQRMLEDAARLHHSLEMTRHPTPLGRLAWNVACGGDGDDRSHGGPRQLQTVAGIIRLCSLLDEQFEALQFDFKDADAILDDLQRFAPLEGFDPALAQHFRQLRCRCLSGSEAHT